MNNPQPFIGWDSAFDEPALWLSPDREGHGGVGFLLGIGRTKADALADARESLVTIAKQLERLEREA